MFEYMDRFGFNKDPELDYPDNQMAPSGVYDTETASSSTGTRVDIGRVAIGQGGEEGRLARRCRWRRSRRRSPTTAS